MNLNAESPQDGAAASEPAIGRMSIKDAARAAVSSMPEFAGKSASSANEELGPDDTVPKAPPATAPKDGSDTDVPLDEEDPAAADKPAAGKQPADDARSLPGEPGPKDADKSALPEAPARWPKEERAWFSTLTEEGKRFALAREKRFNTAYTQVTQELSDTRKNHERLTGAFTPAYRSQMQRAGLDERGALDYLVQFHDLYETNPVRYVQAAIQAKGLTPQQIFPDLASHAQPSPTPAPTPGDEEWLDPVVLKHTQQITTGFNQELETVKRTLAELTKAHQDNHTRHQQAQLLEKQTMLESLETVVGDFAAATDEAGGARYPHLESVFDTMLYLMKTNPALQAIPVARAQDKMEQAYEMAVRLNPDLYQQRIQTDVERRLADEKKRLADGQAAEAAARARRVSTVKPSPGASGASVAQGKMSIRDAARKAVSQHFS